MKLATVKIGEGEEAAVMIQKGVVYVRTVNEKLNQNWPLEVFELIETGQLEKMNQWYKNGGKKAIEELDEIIPKEEVLFRPLYRNPRKIWGIGLNYVDHAADLSEKAPSIAPASFMKPDTTIIGYKDDIKIPLQSDKTTGESELGVIIGKRCKDVERENWIDVVAGFTTIIDMTAEDILKLNPRYLTRAKSFDTFFSFGPCLVTPDEIEDVLTLQVATVINKKIHAQNTVSNMTFPPDHLVSFHSKVMTMLPGDIISTGTPRAVHIHEGDVIECWIDGLEPLINPVIDLKIKKK
ncbi:fumarylacetoacetate hydrolase family protein [Crassaminicella profunda]|uniref:fumarylacetoacetate hydrolase family protein n=1 Tax=Crassaminicella profunda TaxID=1286698 RepID=UPI001CA64178|nr:fumarylacetoacetate hydrolase family protein [Crassaminicella profunda]QZY55218.1 fumarylacetoacetate hydrolase family protein [Crassaminicella profunda]